MKSGAREAMEKGMVDAVEGSAEETAAAAAMAEGLEREGVCVRCRWDRFRRFVGRSGCRRRTRRIAVECSRPSYDDDGGAKIT
ncbi:putative basic proline-rich protein-like [Iris pallida]|uniref:Basic proline-rich protein-like n=1 Tax=Iris pallida TaxID=29817 RepID=A0AAX6F6N3_IRIPA|nr:putative basic proline-rich protein-like [Iris pallida]